MIYTKEELEAKLNITPGTRIIIIRGGGGLSYNEGNVFTFAGWWDKESAKNSSFYKMFPDYLSDFDEGQCKYHQYCQVQELLDEGNLDHNLDFNAIKVFNPDVHTVHRIMTKEELEKDLNEFVEKYGA